MTQPQHRSNVELAVKRYSSLFRLPSRRGAITILYAACLAIGFTLELTSDFSIIGIMKGLLLGTILFVVTLVSDFLTAKLILKNDVILMKFRRCVFLSFSSNLLFIIFVLIASVLAPYPLNADLFVKTASLGFFASLTLRFLVFHSVSFSGSSARFLSSILQPSLIFLVLTVIFNFKVHHTFYFLLATLAAFTGIWVFKKLLNDIGMKTFGVPSLEIFRAFLANWTEGVEKPFEDLLERIGEEHDINTSIMIFRSKHGKKLKAILVAPNLHPGPFKNIGSSPLPGLIQDLLEKEMECVVSVPHGISGHDLDLTSQIQNKKVLRILSEAIKKQHDFHQYATPFIKVEKRAKAGCQVFGNCAFLTLTLAPETMEDLPLELNNAIINEAVKTGFSWVISIDAHNSINGPFNIEEATTFLREAAISVLEEARGYAGDKFKVGAGKTVVTDFGIEDGIGPGGITAIVIEVGDQRTAYITIDGNNMVSGLREKILLELKGFGIDCGEIFTTDTHIVNAVVLAERGYHPIGEAISHDKIIEYVRSAVSESVKNLEPAEIAWCKALIDGVKVIGEKQINDLGLLTDKVARKAKRSSFLIFSAFGLILIALFMLF